MSHSINLTVKDTNLLKGLAISAVVLLHVLAYLKGIYFASASQWFYVLIDQLSRFCVPLFLMVSGYGLASKYAGQQLVVGAYLFKRLTGLLPAYVFWSVVSMVIITSVPAWSNGNLPGQWGLQLLLGQADYQLYFVPVLVQMYLVFPLLWSSRKWLKWWTLGAFVVQLLWVLWLGNRLPLLHLPSHFQSDRVEYLLGLSWIGYFTLGIWLKQIKFSTLLSVVAPLMTLAMLAAIVVATMNSINSGTDPLLALKFTRWPVMVFATAMCFSLMRWAPSVRRQIRGVFTDAVEWLGQNSLVVFLSHTIGLRLAYAAVHNQLQWYVWVLVAMAWSLAIYTTVKWLQR